MLASVCTSSVLGQNADKKTRARKITLQCEQPPYLKAGDRVALISPAYIVSLDDVKKAAEVLRGWGLVPVIGIPLPFFSYGGSSFLAFTLLLFVFIRQDADRNALI